MTDTLNDDLAAILDLATEIQEADQTDREPAAALRYAVLKRIEDDLEFPALVKYGDADAVADEYGIEGDRVWHMADEADYTLFYVEPEETLHTEMRCRLDQQFLAIGAQYLGCPGTALHKRDLHRLYLWPEDHPILRWLPRTP